MHCQHGCLGLEHAVWTESGDKAAASLIAADKCWLSAMCGKPPAVTPAVTAGQASTAVAGPASAVAAAKAAAACHAVQANILGWQTRRQDLPSPWAQLQSWASCLQMSVTVPSEAKQMKDRSETLWVSKERSTAHEIAQGIKQQ